MRSTLVVGLAMLLLSPPARAVTLEDGVEVIVLPIAGASTVSLRYVVKAGSTADPPGKAGLAHLLEHAIFQGSRHIDEATLRDAAHAAGAQINAFTSGRATVFTLDAPRARFAELAETYLRVITNPRLEKVDLDRENAVIATEELLRPSGASLLDFVEVALFSSSEADRPILGTRRSRGAFDLKDLITFYQEHYRSTNTVVVVAGDVTEDSVKELLAKAILLPPSLPSERPAPRPARTPSLPFEAKMRGRITLATFGYRLERQDWEACATLAGLVELRLALALQVNEPMAEALEVRCGELGGNTFLLAFAFSGGIQGNRVPGVLAETMAGFATQPPRRNELEMVAQRLTRRRATIAAAPAALAEQVVSEVTNALPLTDPASAGQPAKPLTSAQCAALIQRTFQDERALRLTFSPFDG